MINTSYLQCFLCPSTAGRVIYAGCWVPSDRASLALSKDTWHSSSPLSQGSPGSLQSQQCIILKPAFGKVGKKETAFG